MLIMQLLGIIFTNPSYIDKYDVYLYQSLQESIQLYMESEDTAKREDALQKQVKVNKNNHFFRISYKNYIY